MASSSGENEKTEVIVPKSAADVQRLKLDKLMKNPLKPVAIPERTDGKLPRVFSPPEFIRNIWGSSAGAGSGDFHVYRGIRRREYARQKFMNEKSKLEEADENYRKKVEENKKAAEARTAKKRLKRLKKRYRQKVKKAKTQTEKNEASDSESEPEDEEEEEKKEQKFKEEANEKD